MKLYLKLAAAALAVSAVISGVSVTASADKVRTVDGVRYVYSDDGKEKGKFSGWVTASNGRKSYYNEGVKVKNSWLKENGVRTYYVDGNGLAVVGERKISGVTYYFGNDAKMLYGISIKGSNISQSGLKLSFGGETVNSTTAEAWTTEEYSIERKNVSGDWEKVSLLSNSKKWDNEKIKLFSEGKLFQRSEDMNWIELYGKLSNGSYRLCKDYYVKLYSAKEPEKKTLYVPFSIKVYDSAETAWGISLTVSGITTDGITITTSQSPGHTGYVRFYDDYMIEQQNSSGKWSIVDKAAYDKAIFYDFYGLFGDYDDPKGYDPGGTDTAVHSYYCGELDPGHYRIKRLFSGDCDGIKGKLYATAEFDIFKDTPNGWGITLSMSGDACESGGTLCVNKTGSQKGENDENTIVGDVWTGEAYTIEKLNGSDWEDIEPIADETWDDVGIILEDGKSRNFVMSWNNLYGKLSIGTYRLGKTFYAKQKGTDKTLEKTMFVEFAIGEGGINIGSYELNITDVLLNKSFLSFNVTRSGKYTGEVSWDGSFEIHRKNSSGKWKLYKGKTALNTESDETEDFPNGETCKTGLYINSVYPDLTPGNYRLVIKTQDQTRHIKYNYALFTVK